MWKRYRPPTGNPVGRPRSATPKVKEPLIEPVFHVHHCDCSGIGVKQISGGKWVCQTCIDRQAYWMRTTLRQRHESTVMDPYRRHAPGFSMLLLAAFLFILPAMAQDPFTFQQVAAYVHVMGRPIVVTEGITNWVFDLQRRDFDTLNDLRKLQSRDIYSWKEFTTNPQVNREYVHDHLKILHSVLKMEMNRAPSHDEVFGAFRFGFKKFKAIKFAWPGDKASQFQLRIFREFIRNPVLCEEPLPPLSVPRPASR